MSEITKLYENAGVKPKYSGWLDMGDLDTQMTYIQCDTKEEWNEYVFMSRSSYSSDDENYDKPKMDYPPFTAEKQLELIKWLSRRYIEISNYDAENGRMYNIKPTVGDFATSFNYDFSECIAGLINNLWQDLTEKEKQQVKGILE